MGQNKPPTKKTVLNKFKLVGGTSCYLCQVAFESFAVHNMITQRSKNLLACKKLRKENTIEGRANTAAQISTQTLIILTPWNSGISEEIW